METPIANQELKVKIKALWDKAISAGQVGNAHEAEAFSKKASELMLKYNLSQMDLEDAKEAPKFAKAFVIPFALVEQRHESDWLAHLFSALCRANFCSIIIDKARGGYVIIGQPENGNAVSYLCIQLTERIRSMAGTEFKKYNGHEKRNTWKRGFLRGCALGIASQLRDQSDKQEREGREAMAAVAKGSKDTGLMVMSNLPAMIEKNNQLIQTFIDRTYPRLKAGSASARLKGSSGFSQGLEKGRSMNIGASKGIGAGGNKTIKLKTL